MRNPVGCSIQEAEGISRGITDENARTHTLELCIYMWMKHLTHNAYIHTYRKHLTPNTYTRTDIYIYA